MLGAARPSTYFIKRTIADGADADVADVPISSLTLSSREPPGVRRSGVRRRVRSIINFYSVSFPRSPTPLIGSCSSFIG